MGRLIWRACRVKIRKGCVLRFARAKVRPLKTARVENGNAFSGLGHTQRPPQRHFFGILCSAFKLSYRSARHILGLLYLTDSAAVLVLD